MELGEPGRKGVPKLREILRRQRGESDSFCDTPDLEFGYDDADEYNNEIAELYSYTEEAEFLHNQNCFDQLCESQDIEKWITLPLEKKRRFIVYLQNELEVANRQRRMRAVQACLYLMQGNFKECENDEDQVWWCKFNIALAYRQGLFVSFVELLGMEIENTTAATSALRKPAVSIADSKDLRLIVNVIYTMVETIRTSDGSKVEEMKDIKELLRNDLAHPLVAGEEILSITLFSMVTKFCSGVAPHFPMKKVLLLLWKVVLVSLGGLRDQYLTKNDVRERNDLPLLPEDPFEVCRNMRASSPPASAADLMEQNFPRRQFRGGKRADLVNLLAKGLTDNKDRRYQSQELQNSMDEPFTENGSENGTENGNGNGSDNDVEQDDDLLPGIDNKSGSDDEMPPTPPRPSTPSLLPPKSLPWKPKVRQKDLEMFLDHTRAKFVGFLVKHDNTSLAGLPDPIHDGVKVFKQHLYLSLSEIQIKREEEIAKNPLSKPEEEVVNTSAEILYQAMLPNLPQYMIALLKILLAAAPTSKAKTESINILADVLPEEMPTTVLQSMKLGIDVNRHKEIVVKAISGLLLLLLKHFKLNHIYQFEFMSQHLVFANCIPLVLKFFNQNIMSYVAAKNTIPMLDFPSCMVGEQPDLTAESLENGDNQTYCWRNLFSCINLLRILNKLTKWKHSRTMMLVVFKSAPILKRALKVKQAIMQLYILKLLKMQTKYLGRQWRKSNMKTMSAIYLKVRHRLNDDWAYGNDMDARPWDFQAEECALRACVDRFNNRRYGTNGNDPDFRPVDNCTLSVLGQNVELSEEFKRNYERWLEMEVYTNQIDWDQMLSH